MAEETNESIGEAVRCLECQGLTDALWLDDEVLTCSFCRAREEEDTPERAVRRRIEEGGDPARACEYVLAAGLAGPYADGRADARDPDRPGARERLRDLWPLSDHRYPEVFAWRLGYLDVEREARP